MAKQRISYVDPAQMTPEMQAEMDRCRREGTPRPESSAVRAHVPAAFWAFANSWRDIFRNGVCDHALKELCRLYVSRTVQCEYCGNQRSIQAKAKGVIEDQVRDLLEFEKSSRYNDRQKAALAYAEAITWRLETDDAFWERLHRHFTEPELVELGCFIALTMGQQSWLQAAQHRAPPGARGYGCVDGARVRERAGARDVEGVGRILGQARTKAGRRLDHER